MSIKLLVITREIPSKQHLLLSDIEMLIPSSSNKALKSSTTKLSSLELKSRKHRICIGLVNIVIIVTYDIPDNKY